MTTTPSPEQTRFKLPSQSPSPVCLLIAALGGEGGGVLTDWIVQAATHSGLPVQSTSIPGVAQRTGATTYYIEIYPQATARPPVLALYPSPGGIDLMVASELLEIGRALENGFIAPDRTTVIGSTHRVFSITEKIAMSDRRYAADSIITAVEELAQNTLLFDLNQLAEQQTSALNAVLAGLIAGCKVLPLAPGAIEQAIRNSGLAVESNLRGFQAGLAYARAESSASPSAPTSPTPQPALSADTSRGNNKTSSALAQRIAEEFPASLHDILQAGVNRLCDYQDEAYAALYLNRLTPLLGQNQPQHLAALRETARYLALWMSYEDVIRVADLKTRPERLQQLRADIGAKIDEPVRVTEFLKPGVEEIAAILPPALARPLRRWGKGRQWSMRVKTHTVSGFLQLRLLARLRRWRPRSQRFQDEQQLIERWLHAIRQANLLHPPLALEIALCANLNKGYGETFERGRHNFMRLLTTLIEPALTQTGATACDEAAAHIKTAREAALADPAGKAVQSVLAQAINWYPANSNKPS